MDLHVSMMRTAAKFETITKGAAMSPPLSARTSFG